MLRGFILLSLITPTITLANIEITEIMYDLEGSDSKREWVEIYNGGEESVDLTDYRFNDGSNHTLVGDNLILPSMSYALLVSDISPVSGFVIDTVMSLNNSGDTISIINSEGEVVESETYTSDYGASGNGMSLQKENGIWIEKYPTPLEGVITKDGVEEVQEEKEIYVPAIEKNIKTNIDVDERGVVGGLISFTARSYGLKDLPLDNARHIWNFGDGNTTEGQKVFHTYEFPGTYVVTLITASNEYSDTKSTEVVMNEASVSISNADEERIEIKNSSNERLNLSSWIIKSNLINFILPKHTYILPNHTATFSSEVTGLSIKDLQKVELLYPNGKVAAEYTKNVPQVVNDIEAEEKEVEYVYIEKEIIVETVATTAPIVLQQATAVETEDEGFSKWVIALVSLIAVASLVAISAKDSSDKPTFSKSIKEDEFKIIE